MTVFESDWAAGQDSFYSYIKLLLGQEGHFLPLYYSLTGLQAARCLPLF